MKKLLLLAIGLLSSNLLPTVISAESTTGDSRTSSLSRQVMHQESKFKEEAKPDTSFSAEVAAKVDLVNETSSPTKINGNGIRQGNLTSPTINDQFPDPNMAAVVAETLGKTVDDVLTEQDKKLTVISDNASNRGIKSIDGIEIFKNLSILRLSNNELTSYPIVLNQLPNLNVLWLNDNKITTLEGFGDTIFPGLTQLYLANNQIQSLPDNFVKYSLGKGTNSEVYLDNNLIQTLPANIGNIEKLKIFTISNNPLDEVPATLFTNPTVREIDLSNDHLVSLPDSFTEGMVLSELTLNNNQLTSLPNSLSKINSLTNLSIEGNLLPTNSDVILSSLITSGVKINSGSYKKLSMKQSGQVYKISSQKDLDNLLSPNSIENLVNLKTASGFEQLYDHRYIITDLFEQSSKRKTVNLSDYISNNVVLKTGQVEAKIRATGEGIFPNNSDNAITDDTILLSFVKPIVKGSVKVKYLDADGTEIHKEQIIKGNVGEAYDASTDTYKLDIEGYTLEKTKLPNNATGTLTDKAQTVTYVYTKNPHKTTSVIVKYVDEQGKKLSSTETINGNVGDTYITVKKKVNGYTFKTVQGVEKGTLTTQSQTVIYIYTKNKESIVTPQSDQSSKPTKDKQAKGILPETGESNGIIYSIIGFVVFILIGVTLFFRRNFQKK